MDFDSFLGAVQNRASLPSTGDAFAVTRITLETLGRRLEEGEATDLAAQLPEEIGRLLVQQEFERFDWDGFVDRLVEQGDYDPDETADAVHHARVVVDVVAEAATAGEVADLREVLPPDYDDLFEVADQETEPVEEERKQ